MLPWLAPILMHNGYPGAALLIYLVYSSQCHQLPQRSFFLFGDQLMIPVEQIMAITGVRDPLTLRWFIGTPQLGWKVAGHGQVLRNGTERQQVRLLAHGQFRS